MQNCAKLEFCKSGIGQFCAKWLLRMIAQIIVFFFAQNWCAKKEKFCVSFRKNCAKVLRMETLLLGGNPSLHWNKYLELWVMVYHGWNGNIYITTARNSLNQLSNLGSHTQLARFEYVLTKYGTTLQYNFSFPNRLFINNQFCYFFIRINNFLFSQLQSISINFHPIPLFSN